jgi:hypothetical protein
LSCLPGAFRGGSVFFVFTKAYMTSERAVPSLSGDLQDFGAFLDRPDETHGIRIQTVADFLASLFSSES